LLLVSAHLLESLTKLKGAEFDRAYIQHIGLEGHKEALEAFNKEASQGANADLKEAALKALPTIQEHYAMAQELAKKKSVPMQ
jgi:predicted outer membrane protein